MPWKKSHLGEFECTGCIIRSNDPMKEVIEDLIEPSFLINGFEYLFRLPVQLFDKINNDLDQEIEIRCIKIDGVHFFEQTWPDKCEIKLNGITIKEIKPLIQNSALKKRRDEKLVLGNGIKIGTNRLAFNYEIIKDGKNTKADKDPKYVFSVFHIKKLTVEELSQKIIQTRSLTQSECQKLLKMNFLANKDLKISELKVDLICKLTLTHLNTPARGRYCTHPSCFSLLYYLKSMEMNFSKNWVCPLCKKPCYKLVVDTYIGSLVKQAKARNLDFNQVIIKNSGEVEFVSESAQDSEYKLESYQRNSKKDSVQKDSIYEVLSQDEEPSSKPLKRTNLNPPPTSLLLAGNKQSIKETTGMKEYQTENAEIGKRTAAPPSVNKNFMDDKEFLIKLLNFVRNKTQTQGSQEYIGSNKSMLASFESNLKKKLSANYFAQKCFQVFYEMIMEKRKEKEFKGLLDSKLSSHFVDSYGSLLGNTNSERSNGPPPNQKSTRTRSQDDLNVLECVLKDYKQEEVFSSQKIINNSDNTDSISM